MTYQAPPRKALSAALAAQFLAKPAPSGFIYKRRADPMPEAAGRIPSPQQAALFDWVRNGCGSAVVQAVAGAGKTTSLVWALGYMTGDIFFGAYNKKIAEEIAAKAEKAGVMRGGLRISTMHAAGFATWMRFADPQRQRTCDVDDRKTSKIVDGLIWDDKPKYQPLLSCMGFVGKMVSFAKQFLIGVNSDPRELQPWLDIVAHFGTDEELPENADLRAILALVVDVFIASKAACKKIIDFDDMIYAPLAWNLRFYQNDWVLVDEAQDTNPARREMARRMLKPDGRLIAVGDSRQAIYGFTGAGADSLERISVDFNCIQLPLTITYRCPKAVVSFAHQWVSHIEAADTAPEGVVRDMILPPVAEGEAVQPWFVIERPHHTSAILCRFTKPLVKTAYGMLRRGIPCKIEGRDLAKGLVALCRRWKLSSTGKLNERLESYLALEIAKARAAGSERREQDVIDRVETIRVFIERCNAAGHRTIDALCAEIESIFADGVENCCTLSTGHKAKGREWPVVYWLTSTKQVSRKDWEHVQEDNIKYVITTRAQSELVLIPEGMQ